jgi:hypothetical protein
MISTLIDRWLRLAEQQRSAIPCKAPECGRFASWCHEWQTPGMPAPAFWYGCDRHTAEAKKQSLALKVSSGLNNQSRHP